MNTASDILGVPVPSDAPAFLMALGAHVAAGLTCVIAGAVAALARKRAGLHSRAGLIYFLGLFWLFVSSTAMSVMRWREDWHLFVIGAVAFGAGTFGYLAGLRRWRAWVELHLVSMGLSYVALLTGFYVDNGPHLPGWRHLPHAVHWLLPTLAGTPLILRALLSRRRTT